LDNALPIVTECAYHSVLDDVCAAVSFHIYFSQATKVGQVEGEDKVTWGKKPFHQYFDYNRCSYMTLYLLLNIALPILMVYMRVLFTAISMCTLIRCQSNFIGSNLYETLTHELSFFLFV